MRAVILEDFESKLRVRDVEPKPPLPSQVIVEIGATGVCHSDLSIVRGMFPLPLPMIIGHEGAGRVIEVGSAVRRVKPGDRVIASFAPACGECWQCTRHASHLCEAADPNIPFTRGSINGQMIPPQVLPGTMAETMTVHEDYLVKIQTDLPDEQLALIGCGVTTGVGAALWAARITPGSTVAVFGAGGVGISAIQGARIAGAAKIIAVDPAPAKRQMALSFGATHYVNPTAHDPVEQIMALTSGRGADYTLEVVGNVEVMQQAYYAARRGGTIVYLGGVSADKKVTLPANDIHRMAKTIIGCTYGFAQVRSDFARIVSLVEAGHLDLNRMISRRFPLDGINEAFEAMDAGQVVRSVLVPHLNASPT
jgi:S-(hydroxymethyl)glutathione dehydrogenase/alcohol dehydrogenase